MKGTKEDGRYIRRKEENGVVFGKYSLKIVWKLEISHRGDSWKDEIAQFFI